MQLVPCCVICCIALTTGADKEGKDQFGMTPLMYACRGGHKDVVSNLIEHGEQLHFFSCCVNCCILKRQKQNVYIV